MEQGIMEQIPGLEELSGNMDGLFPEFRMDFSAFFSQILAGDPVGAAAGLATSFGQALGAEAAGLRNLFVTILLIGVISALSAVLTGALKNHQTADMAHFISYLMMLSMVLTTYLYAAETARGLLEGMLLFVRLFIPTFMLALGMSAGTTVAAGYYQLILLLIYGVEQFLVGVGLPAVHFYMMLSAMNGIWGEERLENMLEFVQKAVSGTLKFLLTCIAGIGLLQSMVSPVLEHLKLTAASRALSTIPGLGGLAEGTARLLLGSAVLIKNGLGVSAILLLILLCSVPMLKLLLYGVILKLCAGLLGLAADKRLTECAKGAGEALFLLLRISWTAGACFLILFAIITCLAGTVR